MKQDIKSMLPVELEECFKTFGEKPYRAWQVFSWLHKGVKSFDEMTDLSLSLREKLDELFFISALNMINKQVSIDGTVKYLWFNEAESAVISSCCAASRNQTRSIAQHDDTTADSVTTSDSVANYSTFESVIMEYKHGNTICVSSQVGCKMGCLFCASSIGGFIRNLAASEMLDQVLFSSEDSGKRISNIVLMGMGEPLDNFDNVIRFIELIREPKGLNIGARHITLSTCGLPEHIDKLTEYGVQLSLAISLHAPDDDTRFMLMPMSRSTGIRALLEAADRYFEKTGRRVTYEYAMIDSINDGTEHAEMLAQLLKNTCSHVNLILLSKVPGSAFLPSKKENINKFAEILKQNDISFTTRRSLGSDIDAACGQLRRRNNN